MIDGTDLRVASGIMYTIDGLRCGSCVIKYFDTHAIVEWSVVRTPGSLYYVHESGYVVNREGRLLGSFSQMAATHRRAFADNHDLQPFRGIFHPAVHKKIDDVQMTPRRHIARSLHHLGQAFLRANWRMRYWFRWRSLFRPLIEQWRDEDPFRGGK